MGFYKYLWYDFLFFIQLVAAEAMFMYAYKRRKYFVLRCLIFTVCYMGIALFKNYFLDKWTEALFELFLPSVVADIIAGALKVVFEISLTIAGMYFCFDGKIESVVPSCTGGYSIQHFCYKLQRLVMAYVPISSLGWSMMPYDIFLTVVFYAVPYIPFFFGFAYPAKKYSYKDRGDSKLNLFSIVMVLCLILINRFESVADVTEPLVRLTCSAYTMALIIALLNIQFFMYRHVKLKVDNETQRLLLSESGKQYEQWKTSLQEINIKYHDLRHELNEIKSMGVEADYSNLERLLNDYGTFIRTGNEMLDVLFTNKRIICKRSDIELTCFIDDGVLTSFSNLDFYMLFENALDNAVNAVKMVQDPEKRIISMSVKKFGDSVNISVRNYFEGELTYSEGVPVSPNKSGMHGYGIKSMQNVCNKYGGTLSIKNDGDCFILSIILPFTAAADSAD